MPIYPFLVTAMSALPGTPDYDESDIRKLVVSFYACIRQDEQLGPIFNRHVQDWDSHLTVLCDFWSALLLGTRRFKGAPIARHAAIPDLNWTLFQRWLTLFNDTTARLDRPALQHKADATAARIATKLWQTYQANSAMTSLPDALPPGLEHYSQSPVFTPENLPAALTRAHTTRAGTWGLLRVYSGILHFSLDQAPFTELVLSAGQTVVIEPGIPHHVRFELPGSFQIEFHKMPG